MRLSPLSQPRTHRRQSTARSLGVVAAAAITLLAGTPARGNAQNDALTLAEVIDLQRRGVSTRRILQTAREYCVAFAVTDSVVRELVASGAASTLVDGIRESCVVTPPVQLPPGVLLDDDFRVVSSLGRFTAIDRLCSVRPDSGGMRVENQRRESGCAISYPYQLDAANVRVELTVAELDGEPGARVALAFGSSVSASDEYTFSVTAQNRFELCTTVGQQCRRLLYESRAGLLRPGTRSENRIAVEIGGREINLYVNDERVGRYLAADAVIGNISLAVGPRTSAVFSRLRVKRIDALAATASR